ncbi:MAG: hypothetical protein IKE31_08170 [Eubacterium sp.]|nr:hypothetical protein [Eubacterium sp.]
MEIEKKVIACAAEVYGKDESEITLQTNIREELSNQSILMIAFTSSLEEELDVAIELKEASKLLTIADFVNRIKEKLA